MENRTEHNPETQSFQIPPELIHTLQTACQLAVLTGAGISAESGVPTFREAQTGLWSRYDPQELATPQAFHRDPKLVWEWYSWRRSLVSQADPNAGHYALAKMEKLVEENNSRFTLITQNVDGLHQRAGSEGIIELHGNINRTKCFLEGIPVEENESSEDIPPRCPVCGGPLRPDVVWFGENLSAQALKSAWDIAQTCDLFFSIGTSTVIEPAASLPHIALNQGAIVVEINPSDTPLTPLATYVLRAPAGEILPALLLSAWGKLPNSQ
jgi:NAD-dependent deacetylase